MVNNNTCQWIHRSPKRRDQSLENLIEENYSPLNNNFTILHTLHPNRTK